MLKLKELTEERLTAMLADADEGLAKRQAMRGKSFLQSDIAWVDEAACRVLMLRQEIAARAGTKT